MPKKPIKKYKTLFKIKRKKEKEYERIINNLYLKLNELFNHNRQLNHNLEIEQNKVASINNDYQHIMNDAKIRLVHTAELIKEMQDLV